MSRGLREREGVLEWQFSGHLSTKGRHSGSLVSFLIKIGADRLGNDLRASLPPRYPRLNDHMQIQSWIGLEIKATLNINGGGGSVGPSGFSKFLMFLLMVDRKTVVKYRDCQFWWIFHEDKALQWLICQGSQCIPA